MDTRKIFPVRLAELRKERGLTQGELADRIGISRQSVTLYERETRIPDIEVLAEIASFFGVTADYLIGLSDARTHEAADISARTGLSEAAVEVLGINSEFGENFSDFVSTLIEKSHEDPGEWIDDEEENECFSAEEISENILQYKKERNAFIQCRHGADVLDALGLYYRIHASYENEFFAISIHDGKLIKTQTTIDILRDVHHPLSFSSKEMLERIMLDRLIDTIKQGADEFADEHPELQVRKEATHAQEE